jgi:hypothetical protein
MESSRYRVLQSKFSIGWSGQKLVEGSLTPEGITPHPSLRWIGCWMGPIIDLVLWQRRQAVAQIVESLRYRPKGRSFDSHSGHRDF